MTRTRDRSREDAEGEGTDGGVFFPIDPILARPVEDFDALPEGEMIFEPKWDGYRCIAFVGRGEVVLQSRNQLDITAYFPEMASAFLRRITTPCVLDGELMVVDGGTPDFGALQARIHPAPSRIALLAERTPACFVAFDLLQLEGSSLLATAFSERRRLLEETGALFEAPLHVTPCTRDVSRARRWFESFTGGGVDGVIAKPADSPYRPGKRDLFKIKHRRTADCVVAGWRPERNGDGVGSLLLGLYDGEGRLWYVGGASGFTRSTRRSLVREIAPLVVADDEPHPWLEDSPVRRPGASNRWKTGRAWLPLRPLRVVEVEYDEATADRFRHATRMLRWRPDKEPREATLDQLAPPSPADLSPLLHPKSPPGSSPS
ncbi:MAG: ATP-dependent DNA ligase [Acidimicrobiales bacterium]|nr:MAG: ATP-dependent DNA ligase [Acidimicrobiales bacterium]